LAAESELAAFTILGTSGKAKTMKVPYAKKWRKETDKLRKIAVDSDLTEALKWGKPCFTFQKKNVAIVIPLKESCAFSFFKGALLKEDSGRAMDQVHLVQRNCAPAVDADGLHLRSHRIGGVREEGRAQEALRVPYS
jgi:uncharacterized protein YdeI (YjbR/CyaY-like superfamily)